MRILVVGGGPAGLFFSIIAKRAVPAAAIHVRERNPQGVTYGWGVSISESAADALRPAAPDVIEAFTTDTRHDRMVLSLDGVDVPVQVGRSHLNARWSLLATLERFALAAGVRIEHERDTAVTGDDLADWDLVIGADGVNSRTRERFAEHFLPSVELGGNWLAWYGTPKPYPPSIILKNSEYGTLMVHASRFSSDMSNFTVEVGQETFDRLGFAGMTEDESRELCERLFADSLDGAPLRSDHSPWFQTKFVSCARWSHRNLVLIGDALHTVHPSIGSGTRFAMRDAVYLTQALAGAGWDVETGLKEFERVRKPVADAFQTAAKRSIAWYEGLPSRTITHPTKFALEYLMRTGRVSYRDFRRENREVVLGYERDLR
ncbi:FAD-dependent monooxygenase [Actinomadura madurae]|uniref:FAD-dependent monooxygenase n=2 Tax=Actinomadura madurae TaxID=1993 RepID=UPI002026A228|nr:FAD-dependent monooxygenase [Actinomadura madurae]MCP9951309.1 FAD-dependent monooxygenase [Actinomadura madurae]MCP9968081.1 FAD-dependent monooxygenase [Actinomadura madurae]MCP9980540.1 FAD-dependent monooxygenase [Actinomadura madurae]MCQ0016742.1 FAD-dependent monooxygenase [Actinomadura madurae]URM96825.1 FAD-dependent monooxygenase [Actinomadura madurae]